MLNPAILDVALTAFVTMFVIIDPIGLLPIFIGLTKDTDASHRVKMAFKGIIIGGTILLFFALLGDRFLGLLGVGIPAFRIAGGVMLFLLALEMVFDKRSQRREDKAEQVKENQSHEDISVFPLSVPLISGPGAIASIMLLMSSQNGDWILQSTVLVVLGAVLLICLMVFLLATPLSKILGQTFTNVLSRVLGVILGALAVQFILDGLKQGLLS